MVTGGASGLGLATAERLVAGGGTAIIADLDEEGGRAAARSLGETAAFVRCDVRNTADVEAAVAGVYEDRGRIDVLVNTAGVGTAARVIGRDGELFDLDVYKFTIEVNLVGAFDVLRQVAGKMASNEPKPTGERGVIVNVASIAAFDGQVGQAAYSASKGGIVGMTLPIARELGRHGIRLMTIAPGVFETPILGMLSEEAIVGLGEQAVFPKRLGQPDEFARMVVAIVENPYLNAETIRLDAGMRMT